MFTIPNTHTNSAAACATSAIIVPSVNTNVYVDPGGYSRAGKGSEALRHQSKKPGTEEKSPSKANR